MRSARLPRDSHSDRGDAEGSAIRQPERQRVTGKIQILLAALATMIFAFSLVVLSSRIVLRWLGWFGILAGVAGDDLRLAVAASRGSGATSGIRPVRYETLGLPYAFLATL
jgi:hypothetical protein